MYLVDFSGYSSGRGTVCVRAEFSTDSPELQAAIEADPRYGTQIVCVQGHTPIEHTEADADPNPAAGSGNGGDPNQENLGNPDKEQVSGVTNAQTAIDWLKTNKGVEFKERPKADKVKAKAAELGVVFVAWK